MNHTSVPLNDEQTTCLLIHGFCILAEEFGNHTCHLMNVGDVVFLEGGQKNYRTVIVAKQLKDANRPSGPAFLVANLY
jgi:hypothetical protein